MSSVLSGSLRLRRQIARLVIKVATVGGSPGISRAEQTLLAMADGISPVERSGDRTD